MSSVDDSRLSQDRFDAILEALVDGMTAAQLLSIEGVYEILAEELNNDILTTWEEQAANGE